VTRPLAIILAGGEGKRMGLPKALLEHDGRTFLSTLISTFNKAGCDCLAVVGRHAQQIRTYKPRCEVVDNPDWEQGQFSSVKAGLEAALAQGAGPMLIHPVDVPMVRASTVKALLEALDDTDGVLPEFEGAPGHPLVLSEAAAKRVMESSAPHLEAAQKELRIGRLKVKDPAVLVDLNTPEAYERVIGAAPKLAEPPKPRAKR
jgi:molybdenum cofactor cytidylyltransferase